MSRQHTSVFVCKDVGVSGTTDVHAVKLESGDFEARVGFALLGSTQMSPEQFAEAEFNPFHEAFHDNYARGIGDTLEAAIEAMKNDIRDIADSVWR